MQLIGRNEQQAIDRLWQERTGLPLLILMEAAAAAVCRSCQQLLDAAGCPSGPVLILAGRGQNGGDALACARQLAASGVRVICREIFPGADLPPEAAANRRAALAMGMELGMLREGDFGRLTAGCLIVDGIFGTGFRSGRSLPPEVLAVSAQIASARAEGVQVVAIDVPSGLDADSGTIAEGTIQPDRTVTFVRPKVGLAAAPGRFLAGEIVVDNIGVPSPWVSEAIDMVRQVSGRPFYDQLDMAMIMSSLPKRPPESHKGMFGKVLLLGGSVGMPGAIALAAEAAARSGAGLLTLGVPASIGALILAARPECLLTLLPEPDADGGTAGVEAQARLEVVVQNLIAGQPAVAAGPGSGKSLWLSWTLPLLIRSVSRLILDADALNLIADDTACYFPLLQARPAAGLPPVILTPHPGEFRRLAPDISLEDRQQAARQLAERSGCVVLLKGASTVIAGPDNRVLINPTGNDGLARGGSGDILSGLIAGLLAQGLNPLQAAACGAYLHGLAADLAAVRLSRRAMLPRDVIESLGAAFRKVGWESG